MRWNYLSIPKLQRCSRWSLGMDKKFHLTLYCACDYLSMLWNGPWSQNHSWERFVCIIIGMYLLLIVRSLQLFTHVGPTQLSWHTQHVTINQLQLAITCYFHQIQILIVSEILFQAWTCYNGEMTKPPITKKPRDLSPAHRSRGGPLWYSQHVGRWWLGAYHAPGHLQPTWCRPPVGRYQDWTDLMKWAGSQRDECYHFPTDSNIIISYEIKTTDHRIASQLYQ